MTSISMKEVIKGLNWQRFRDRSLLDRIPLLGPVVSVLFEYGLYEGSYVREWLGNELANLNVTTFASEPLRRRRERHLFRRRGGSQLVGARIRAGRVVDGGVRLGDGLRQAELIRRRNRRVAWPRSGLAGVWIMQSAPFVTGSATMVGLNISRTHGYTSMCC
jgi:hypothetical protein